MNEGYTKVFVSLDGTEQQDFVLARAIKVAANNGAKLIIGHVIDSTALENAGSYPVDLVNGLEEAFKNSIAKQLEEAKANPDIPEVEVMIRAGRIRETLKDEMLDVVKPDRSDMDIVFEMMLKWGLELTLPVEKEEVAGYPVYSVACGELVCCLADGLTMEALDAIADMEPRRVLMRDSILTDTLKLNAVQAFRRVEERAGYEVQLRTV